MQTARRLVTIPSKNSFSRRLVLSHSKRAFNGTTNLVGGSNIQLRGRSYAATVPSDISKFEKGRKRVSKDERRAMVESFVTKYKAMNAGKFPSASDARKQVGGSYYVVKKILQELEYDFKFSPLPKRILTKESTKDNESLAESEEVVMLDVGVQNETLKASTADTSEASGKHFEEIITSRTTGNLSDYIATETQLQMWKSKEVAYPLTERPDDGKKEESATQDLEYGDRPKHESPHHQGPLKSDNFRVDAPRKHTNEDELPRKSSMWGNLKSLADGIINMWRKL